MAQRCNFHKRHDKQSYYFHIIAKTLSHANMIVP